MPLQASAATKTKTVHSLKPPRSEYTWPVISSHLEAEILDLLVPHLEPIGQYREANTTLSTGKASRKASKGRASEANDSKQDVSAAPEIYKHLTIGFNSTVRCLEDLAKSHTRGTEQDGGAVEASFAPSVIFVALSELPQIMTASLPVLAATASLSSKDTPIRLVPLSKSATARIAGALKQPRVNILGVSQGAPGMKPLQALLVERVPPVDVSWVRDAASTRYLPVKIHSQEVAIGEKKDRKRKRASEQTS